jgi:hypothetical protein
MHGFAMTEFDKVCNTVLYCTSLSSFDKESVIFMCLTLWSHQPSSNLQFLPFTECLQPFTNMPFLPIVKLPSLTFTKY